MREIDVPRGGFILVEKVIFFSQIHRCHDVTFPSFSTLACHSVASFPRIMKISFSPSFAISGGALDYAGGSFEATDFSDGNYEEKDLLGL